MSKKRKIETIDIGDYEFTVLYEYRKSGQKKLRATDSTQGVYLRDVYGRYSEDKIWAWRRCLDMCKEMGGTNFRITGHNCMAFTVAFEVVFDDCPARIVCTRDYDYLIFKEA